MTEKYIQKPVTFVTFLVKFVISYRDSILVDGGYIERGVYHYYMTDHLGNNRVGVNASGTATQRNHYYPFGTAFAENTTDEQKKQPYKYSGKELDQMHGLNLYDYSARYYESAIGRFTTVNPLAEKYYNISPYAYVENNPLKYIDPNVEDIWIFYKDDDGNEQHWVFNGSNHKEAPKTKNNFISNFLIAYDHNIRNGGGEFMQLAATSKDLTINLKYGENNLYKGW
ncbi:RHS repeat domain-containing protein [Dysgonomonas mossii]|nr:RHS repeat-associated core domain-containing protein [Dysgonomonas mossii]